MFIYPEQAIQEATHTDDMGYLYRVLGKEPKEFCVDYWDVRFNRWCQDIGKSFVYLINLKEKALQAEKQAL